MIQLLNGKLKELLMSPKAFVSYSWDSEEHKCWVAKLSAQLRSDGIETILDQWHVVPGDQLPEFMEREIRANDYALVICTPKYKSKSDARSGGVGYEGDVMTAEVFAKGNHRKYIPILAQGTWIESAPSWFAGKYYIDLSSTERYEQGYKELLATIHGHRPKAPPVGRKPDYLEGTPKAVVPDTKQTEGIYIEGVIVDEVTTPRLDGSRGLNQKVEEYEKDKHSHESRFFKNFIKAEPSIVEYLEKSLKKNAKTSICVIGVSLRYSWPVIKNVTQEYYVENKQKKTIEIKLCLIDEGWVMQSGLSLMHMRKMHTDEDIRQYRKTYQSLISRGILNLSVHYYSSFPHMHGICIDNEELFLSDSYWQKSNTRENKSSSPMLTIGENEYILYSVNDKPIGEEKISQFNHYYDFLGKTGRSSI